MASASALSAGLDDRRPGEHARLLTKVHIFLRAPGEVTV